MMAYGSHNLPPGMHPHDAEPPEDTEQERPTEPSGQERWSGDTENFIRGLRQWMETAETRQDLVEVPVEVLLEAIDRLRENAGTAGKHEGSSP